MASKCQIGYEVSLSVPSLKTQRSVVFTGRKAARDFRRKWPGSKLAVVELCDGVIRRRGKRAF